MLNVVALMGRVVADPELRHTANGVAVCSFTLAVQRSFVRQGEERPADFINIVCWRSTAEFVSKHFSKGSLIAVDGTLQTRTYEDKNGNKRKAVEVVANNVHFAESRKDGNFEKSPEKTFDSSSQTSYSSGSESDFQSTDSDDDLPF